MVGRLLLFVVIVVVVLAVADTYVGSGRFVHEARELADRALGILQQLLQHVQQRLSYQGARQHQRPGRSQGLRLGQGLDTDPPVVRIQPEGCPVVEVEVKAPVGRNI